MGTHEACGAAIMEHYPDVQSAVVDELVTRQTLETNVAAEQRVLGRIELGGEKDA